jgi:hypothetical protein
MLRSLALITAFSFSSVEVCCGLSTKIAWKASFSRSPSASGGGAGNGWARSTIAKASASSTGRPVLSSSQLEINLPERSTTKPTFAVPPLPTAPLPRVEIPCCRSSEWRVVFAIPRQRPSARNRAWPRQLESKDSRLVATWVDLTISNYCDYGIRGRVDRNINRKRRMDLQCLCWAGDRCKMIEKTKSRARPASPRSRPTSPVNGAGGITGCRDDSDATESFQSAQNIFVHG